MGQFTAIIIIAMAPVLYLLWEAYGIYQDTRPNKMRAVFINESRHVSPQRVNINEDGKTFTVGKNKPMKYHIQEACIYRIGTWRVPTSYYATGQADPIDIRNASSTSTQSAEAFHEATEAHVARDIINSFSEPFITITSSMMIVLAVVAIANGVVYVQLNSQLDIIKAALGIVE